jgi:hypothetical protein
VILLSELAAQFDQMSDRELRDVCRILMPIIGRRFKKTKPDDEYAGYVQDCMNGHASIYHPARCSCRSCYQRKHGAL